MVCNVADGLSPPSLPHSFIHSLIHSPIHSLSLPPSLTHSPIHLLVHSLMDSLIPSVLRLLTHSPHIYLKLSVLQALY